MPDIPLPYGFKGGPIVFQVVKVGTVDDDEEESQRIRLCRAYAVDLVLAEEAPIRRNLRKRRIAELMGVQDNVTTSEGPR